MIITFYIIVLICCIGIVWQDFCKRAVYWWLFPTLIFASTGFLFFSDNFFLFTEYKINLAICMFTVSSCGLYYIFRYGKKGITQLSNSIGLGDILMVPVFIISFSPVNFILVTVLSLIFSLLSYTLSSLTHLPQKTIPLAGFLSLSIVIAYTLSITNTYDILNDNLILTWLMN